MTVESLTLTPAQIQDLIANSKLLQGGPPSGIVPGNFSTANLANRGGAGVPSGILPGNFSTANLANQGGAPANRSAGVVRDNFGGNPFAASVVKSEQRLDPITQQLLFGLDGQGGFIPGAFRAAERTFFDDQGRPLVVPQEIAGLSPDQIRAMRLARSNVGVQQPFLDRAAELGEQGIASITGGVEEARDLAIGSERRLRRDLGEAQRLLRGTTGDIDIAAETQRFQDPFEDQVVQQMIQDATEGLAKQDAAQFARDVATGGESAFGSRARLSAAERAEALGRGLARSVGGLRSQGFQRAQQTALAEDERQRQAARAAASGLAGLSGQRFAAGTGLGRTLASLGAQQGAAQTGFGGFLSGLGQQAQQAGAQDVASLRGIGALAQQQRQRELDAQRAALLQAQQAPLAQFNALLPFVGLAGRGTTQIRTDFTPPPSPLQAGLGAGLSTLGALGNFFNPPQQFRGGFVS